MNSIFLLIELSPIILAVIAILTAGYVYPYTQPGRERVFVLLGIISSALLIMAQTALFISQFVTHHPETKFSYVIWAIFNNLVMIMILVRIAPKLKRKDPDEVLPSE